MELKSRSIFIIKQSLENIDRAKNEEVVKNEINNLQHQLDLLNGSDATDVIKLRGSAMPEVIQNLKIDRNNWGCARTGFIYNRQGMLSHRRTPL